MSSAPIRQMVAWQPTICCCWMIRAMHCLPTTLCFLASADAAAQPEFMQAIDAFIDSIPDAAMRQANRLVDVDGESINVAIEYLRGEMARN